MNKNNLSYAFLVFVIYALINILPLLLLNIGGDIDFHLALIKCFAGAFWQGDIYPRWCMDANTGLGSPLPLFYFPLPYYVTALFYPLSYLGVSLHGVYDLSVFLASVVTGLTCYLWLKDIVSPGRALLVSILFLFLPYRMEVMLYRSAYAELWGIALLPLVFKYTRRQNMVPLAAVFGLLFITHLPTAAVAIAGSGLYMLAMSDKTWLPKFRYAASVLWGMALAAFYVVPAVYYQRFLVKEPIFITTNSRSRGWPNTYLTLHNVHHQTPLVLMTVLTILALVLLAYYVISRRIRISNGYVQHETCAWGVIFIAAIFLLFPVSSPLYGLLGPVTQVVFPWRMQQLFMLALAFFAAVWMQWFAGARRTNTWRADFASLLTLLVLMDCSISGSRDENAVVLAQKIDLLIPATSEEYRTLWTDADHFTLEYLLSRYDNRDTLPRSKIISGTGDITIEHWAWDGITMQADSEHGITVRLDQFYFPVWSVLSGDGEPVALYPEMNTGQMLLNIPAGHRRILLHYAVSNARPWLVECADVVSILAALSWLALVYYRGARR